MPGGFFQALDDMARITANGMTFGAADKIAAALGEQDTAAKTAAARDRAGIAGDVANVLGIGGGLKTAWGGVKLVPKIAKAALSKKGAAAALAGIGSLISYNERTSAGGATAAPAPVKAQPAAATKVLPGAPSYANADSMKGDIMASLGAVDESPPTFSGMAQQLADTQGGKISPRQLIAMSEVAQRSTPRAGKIPQPGDAAGHMLEQQYVTQFQKALNDPNADPAAAQKEFEEKVLQLRKTQFIDPYGQFGD